MITLLRRVRSQEGNSNEALPVYSVCPWFVPLTLRVRRRALTLKKRQSYSRSPRPVCWVVLLVWELLFLLSRDWLAPSAMIWFATFRPTMIATARPIAGTSPYLTKIKSTNAHKIRHVQMDIAFIRLEVVFDFIRFVVILHPTLRVRRRPLAPKRSRAIHARLDPLVRPRFALYKK